MNEKYNKIQNFYLNTLPLESKNKIAMICTASNGYEKKYSNLLYSHYIYCKKYNYDYILFTEAIDKPKWEIIYKTNKLLQKNIYQILIMIDADIFIQFNSPNIISILSNKFSIYIANGVSKRVNSGLIVLQNNKHALEFFNRIMKLENPEKIELKNRVTKEGENGAVIQVLNNNYFNNKKFILDNKWNNTIPNKECYFKHYTNYMKKYFQNDNKNIYNKIKKEELYEYFIKLLNVT